MAEFNNFISLAGLFEYDMRGCRFSWMSDDEKKMRKIDRVLVCQNFPSHLSCASVTALPRHLAEYNPIIFNGKDLRFELIHLNYLTLG
ncbi:hypothetical protein HanIR_Chr13g0661941 [Helianthus annuus]|nr:hypothetical protein HanIR_Chr13g0661941 [Helianthus annuus]KAJ0499304.1 hypothetical protein HanHA89_Chr13g0532641 [Helianthus annuus]KAJ0665324.1 hypothetical protein HanLR1_Chr13g0502731 [Helianthus annuus]